MPSQFGLNPAGLTLHGIDVASPQGPNFDWAAAVADGVEFAWIQVYGPASKYRERNWQACRDAGILRGPYGFLSMLVDGRSQADGFLRELDQLGGYVDDDIHPMVDVESIAGNPSKQRVLDTVMGFVERVESELGRPCVIYTFPSYFQERVGSPHPHPLGDRPLMISNFSVNPETGAVYKLDHPIVPATWSKWDVWQVTGNKAYKVAGVEVDADVFWGTRDEFLSRFTKRGPVVVAQLDGAASSIRAGAGDEPA